MSKIILLGNDEVGIYAFRRDLITRLAKQGNTVIVGFPWANNPARIRALGCEIVNTSINRHGTNIIEDIQLLNNYLKLFRDYHPDVVLTYTIKPNLYASFACQICGIPYLNNITGMGAVFQQDTMLAWLVAFLQKWAYRKSSCVFFQNRANMERCCQLGIVSPVTPMRLLPGSGVNLALHAYEPFPENDGVIRFITVARIQRAKGYTELFQAAGQIKEKYPNIEFHIVGRYEEETFKDEVEHLVREGIIVYHGEMMQEDVHRLLAQCNCLVHPAYHEGMSNVCLEAAAAGRPILASDIPGCRETFDEGISGYGFQAKDANALYMVVEKFIHTPLKQQEEMGLRGRKKMEREFDRQIVVNAYLEEIAKIAKKA